MTNILTFSSLDYDVIDFSKLEHPRIKLRPFYYESGLSSNDRMVGRRVVFSKILQAIDYIPKNYGFLILDIYRPRTVQAKLFAWMRQEVQKKYPHFTDEENYLEAKKFASPPSTIGESRCPPHLSGGAIDLTLFDIKTKQELDMGTPFDDCTEKAHSNYFEKQTILTPEEQEIKLRRQTFANAMKNVGFTSYEYEWWHFDIGNAFWSSSVNLPPAFGPLFGDEEWNEAMIVV